MSKENFIRKITSRKFWVALVAFVTALLTAFSVPDASIAQVTSIIMAFGSLIIYMLSESATDVASLNANTTSHDTYVNKSGQWENDNGIRQKQSNSDSTE